jgi:putative ABC transport system permease protein
MAFNPRVHFPIKFQLSTWLTLGGILGIGLACAAMGLALHTLVIVRPLPFPDATRLVQVWARSAETGWDKIALLRDEAWVVQGVPAFDRVAGYRVADVSLAALGSTARVRSATVTSSSFVLFGVTTRHGSAFVDAHDVAGGPRAVAISEALWARLFDRDTGAIGTAVLVDGVPAELVGVFSSVKPPALSREIDVLVSASIPTDTTVREWYVTGRLGPGSTPALAAEQVSRILDGSSLGAGTDDRLQGQVLDLDTEERAHLRAQFILIAVMCGAFLFLVVANAGTVLATEGLASQPSVGIRLALGATSGRLLRDVTVQALAVAAAVWLASVPLILWSTDWVSAYTPVQQHVPDSKLDPLAVMFAGLLAVIVVPPLFWAVLAPITSREPATLLRHSSRTGRSLGSHRRWRWALMIQAAASTASLHVALVAAVTLVETASTHPGINATNVVAVDFALGSRPPDPDHTRAFLHSLKQRALEVPGAQDVALASAPPFRGRRTERFVELEDAGERRQVSAALRLVGGEYFRLLEVPVVGSPPVHSELPEGGVGVYVNRAFSERYFSQAPALGAPLIVGGAGPGGRSVGEPFAAVVAGTVGDVRYWSLRTEAPPEVYADITRFPQLDEGTVLVRFADPSDATVARLLEQLRHVSSDHVVYNARLLENDIRATMAQERLNALLFASVAAGALAVTVIGIVGLVRRTLAERKHELAIRMAFGARGAELARTVLATALLPGAVGVALGAGAAAAGDELLAAAVAVHGRSPAILAGAAVVVLFCLASAGLIPASRLTRLDPAALLRT